MSDPTPSEVLAGTGGRISVLQTEVIRLLMAVLPGTVDLVNTREGIDIAGRASQPGKRINFYAVRESLEGAQLPCVAVGSAVGAESLGTQEDAETITLMIYVVTARTEVREQVDDMWDLAQLVRKIMKTQRGAHCLPDPDGRKVWNFCRFAGMTALPMDWEAYSGLAIHFEVGQAALTLWAQS